MRDATGQLPQCAHFLVLHVSPRFLGQFLAFRDNLHEAEPEIPHHAAATDKCDDPNRRAWRAVDGDGNDGRTGEDRGEEIDIGREVECVAARQAMQGQTHTPATGQV